MKEKMLLIHSRYSEKLSIMAQIRGSCEQRINFPMFQGQCYSVQMSFHFWFLAVLKNKWIKQNTLFEWTVLGNGNS